MPAPRDRASLIKAARMYFLDGRSQDEVAKALGTSRSNVSRMLTAARAQGIVEIRVHDQTSREKELENALRERFALGVGDRDQWHLRVFVVERAIVRIIQTSMERGHLRRPQSAR